MKYGILKDIKEGEFRVITTPAEVMSIVAAGHEVWAVHDCGKAAGFPDEKYIEAGAKIVDTAKRTGAKVSGPIPLPTEKEIITILRAVHKYKDSREQFEMRTHKRLIDIHDFNAKTTGALTKLVMPAGVDIEMKL